MEYEDKELTCVEGNDHTFTWTAKDQAFYAEKGFSAPKRCKRHAQERRAFFDAHPEKVGGAQKRGFQPKERRDRRRDRDMFGADE
jgi:hypothetical protein